MQRTPRPVALAAVLLTALAGGPVFAASAPAMLASTIVVNGRTLFAPDRFVANHTTYMPIWYVIQTLKKLGLQNAWNGDTRTWAVTDTAYTGGLDLNAGSGQATISINGAVAEQKIPTLVARDPKSGVNTTFAPIWYIQQLLNHVGLKVDVWDGTKGTWTLSTAAAPAAPTSPVQGAGAATAVNADTNFPNAATIAHYAGAVNPAPQGVTLAQWQADVVHQFGVVFKGGTSILGWTDPLATQTQWYPDPHDVFYNKTFPVQDLKNGAILQKDPLVEVLALHGLSYVYVNEYAGYGDNPAGAGGSTWWKQEEVSLTSGGGIQAGQVIGVVPGLVGYPVHDPSYKVMQPIKGQGVYFPVHGTGPSSSEQPLSTYWGIWAGNAGNGSYVIPFPGWTPFHLSGYSRTFVEKENNQSVNPSAP